MSTGPCIAPTMSSAATTITGETGTNSRATPAVVTDIARHSQVRSVPRLPRLPAMSAAAPPATAMADQARPTMPAPASRTSSRTTGTVIANAPKPA